jgi:formylmethanofuran dehydrogenase subunit E
MACTIDKEIIDKIISFHGHSCPGLSVGIRAAEKALKEIGHASDEEIVAVVETDMCGVDAIQFVTGCTFGKGNLIHKNFGKNAFSFYRRSDGKSMRIITKPEIFGPRHEKLRDLNRKMATEALPSEEQKQWQMLREELSEKIMRSKFDELFDLKPADEQVPQKARIMTSLLCEDCGEAAMESLTRRMGGRVLCIPCFEVLDKR